MTRVRQPEDWGRDRESARESERRVHEALAAHPQVSHLSDFTEEMDALDFEFMFEGAGVRVDVKAKQSLSSDEIAGQWPEVPRRDLFVLDETSFRTLLWSEGLGYLLIADGPAARWHVFGPWELSLGPRRRFERRGDRGAGEFLKGKLLLDLRTAARTTDELDIGAFLGVVRASRSALHQVRGWKVRGRDELPVVPRLRLRPPAPSPRPPASVEPAPGPTVEPAPDTAWAGLSAELARSLRDRWGWNEPTAVQREAFPAVLAGQNTLVLGPTAGGKTEAALLPLLDRWRQGGWRGRRPSILAVSPLRALIDDQLERWRNAGALVGATAFAWHGDVGRDEKRAFENHPSDALLITPESLELLLTSASHDDRKLFAGLHAVVIDEVHSFVGTPRGAQLASLVERLDRVLDADLQRVGLSATISNPTEVLGWLAGTSQREAAVVGRASPVQGEELALLTYEDLPEAARVVDAAVAGDRALVFVRSRRRAEELGHALGVPVHHGSLSAEGRVDALQALVSGQVDAVVATATLEMGIDVGDLDLVVHDGAPSTPASYLQRLGRSGRKSGNRRMTFTTGEPDDLLLILGVLARARRGDLGRLPPQRGSRLVLGQQALALSLQSFITYRHELRETLRWSPAFAGLDTDIDATIDHLLHGRWLQADGDRLVVGPEGQRVFGGPAGVTKLLASFTTGELAKVVDEAGHHVIDLDWSQVERPGNGDGDRGGGLVLSGKTWELVRVDRAAGIVVVRPATRGRPPSWKGPVMEVDRATWEAVREVLVGTDVPLEMDDRARGWLADSRRRWEARLESPVRVADDTTVIDSFGGVAVHRAVLAMLGVDGHADGTTCTMEAPIAVVRQRAASVLDDLATALDAEAARIAPQLPVAHPELTPRSVLVAEARAFHVDAEGIEGVLALAAGR